MTAARSTTTLSDGRSLSWLELGDPAGVPLLFTIGSPSSAEGGRAWADAAARNGIRLVSIDKPGYAESTRAPKRTLLGYGDDVRQLADALGLEKVHLCGQSGGGPHSLAAAYVLGDRVVTLTLLAAAAPLHEKWVHEDMNGLMRSTVWSANHAPALMVLPVGLIRLMMGTPARAEKMLSRSVHKLSERERQDMTGPGARSILDGTSEAFAHGTGAACDEFLAIGRPSGFRVEDVLARTLMWHGTKDASCPITMARELAKRLPNAELHELDGLGHGFFGPELDDVMTAIRESEVRS